MDKMEWIAPCHFGLESVLKREIQDLGYETVQVEDGRVTFCGGIEAVCRARKSWKSSAGDMTVLSFWTEERAYYKNPFLYSVGLLPVHFRKISA